MADASQYPVTLGYKATTPPYGTALRPYHKGIDYGCPAGTPVVVNGVQIGLSGATGFVTGAHLHVGRFVNGADTNPAGGFKFNSAVVTEIGYDINNGNFVRLQADGASWVYCHLNSTNVTKGQVLKGEPMVNRGDIINMWKSTGIKTDPPESYLKHWDGKDWKSFMYDLTQQNEWKQGASVPSATVLKPGIYKVN